MDEIDMNPQVPLKNGGSGTGPVIAIIVIVIILVLGGIYFITEKSSPQTSPSSAEADQKNLESLMSQGSDDTAAAIQADVQATDLTPVDQSVTDADASVQ